MGGYEHRLLAGAYAELTFLGPAPLPERDFVVRGDREHLEPVLERLERLRRREPESPALARLSGARVRAMIETAGEGQVIAHPVLLPHSVVLLVAADGQISVRERFVDGESLRLAIGRLTELAESPDTALSRWTADSEYVSARLLEPGLSEVSAPRHLLWLAQGELEQLPLALLSWQGKSLLESMSVTYLDGPASLPRFTAGASQGALLIGGSDDLVGAAVELEKVRQLLPASQSWRLGEPFARLQELSERFEIVHIASHGLLPSSKRVGGELSGTAGSLSAFRLADLNFAPGSLVVASACEVGSKTGSGPGDSTVLHALRTAGAGTVIGSPWPIDDQASGSLSLSFYRHLLSGQPPPVALASAQLEVRTTHPHPFFWAGTRVVTGPRLRRTIETKRLDQRLGDEARL